MRRCRSFDLSGRFEERVAVYHKITFLTDNERLDQVCQQGADKEEKSLFVQGASLFLQHQKSHRSQERLVYLPQDLWKYS